MEGKKCPEKKFVTFLRSDVFILHFKPQFLILFTISLFGMKAQSCGRSYWFVQYDHGRAARGSSL